MATSHELIPDQDQSGISRAELQRVHTKAPYVPVEAEDDLPEIQITKPRDGSGRMILNFTEDGHLEMIITSTKD